MNLQQLTKESPPSRAPGWKSGAGFMILGLLGGFILSWSGRLVDWILRPPDGSYIMFTIPLFGYLGFCMFIVGLFAFIIAVVRAVVRRVRMRDDKGVS